MKKIVFIYNAKNGLWQAALDSIHKTVSPQTYECKLCGLTYGFFAMKKEWKEFLHSLETRGFVMEFRYASDFPELAGVLPAVLLTDSEKNHQQVLINKKDFDKINDLNELIDMISEYC